jgi:hypothetical protein
MILIDQIYKALSLKRFHWRLARYKNHWQSKENEQRGVVPAIDTFLKQMMKLCMPRACKKCMNIDNTKCETTFRLKSTPCLVFRVLIISSNLHIAQ